MRLGVGSGVLHSDSMSGCRSSLNRNATDASTRGVDAHVVLSNRATSSTVSDPFSNGVSAATLSSRQAANRAQMCGLHAPSTHATMCWSQRWHRAVTLAASQRISMLNASLVATSAAAIDPAHALLVGIGPRTSGSSFGSSRQLADR
jgi:hypothetical protein